DRVTMRVFKGTILMASLLATGAFPSSYDTAILQDHPAMYLPLASPRGGGVEPDLASGRHPGTYFPRTSSPKKARLPNGDVAADFDGFTQYVEVPSALSLSVRLGHALTIEAWIRPDTLQFPSYEKEEYVHWAGKGEPGQEEWVCRIYSLRNTALRP